MFNNLEHVINFLIIEFILLSFAAIEVAMRGNLKTVLIDDNSALGCIHSSCHGHVDC
jgi:hypothetical protein